MGEILQIGTIYQQFPNWEISSPLFGVGGNFFMLDNIVLEQLCAWILNHRCFACCAAGGKMQLPKEETTAKKMNEFKKRKKSMAVIPQNKRVTWNVLAAMWEN